ncbi:hypothetical protein KM043_004546 [Ampulex compressa]|nr:hypothetical protein KM043_004546 [Ampulex compressa]
MQNGYKCEEGEEIGRTSDEASKNGDEAEETFHYPQKSSITHDSAIYNVPRPPSLDHAPLISPKSKNTAVTPTNSPITKPPLVPHPRPRMQLQEEIPPGPRKRLLSSARRA